MNTALGNMQISPKNSLSRPKEYISQVFTQHRISKPYKAKCAKTVIAYKRLLYEYSISTCSNLAHTLFRRAGKHYMVHLCILYLR